MRRASETSSSPSSRTHTPGAKVSTNVFTSSSVTARGAADMVPGMGGPVSFARCLNYNLDSQSPVDSYSERSPIQVMVEGTPLVRPPTRYAGADTVTRMARAQVMSDTSTGIWTRTPEPTRAPSDSTSQLESRLHLSSFRSAFRGLVHTRSDQICTMRGYGNLVGSCHL